MRPKKILIIMAVFAMALPSGTWVSAQSPDKTTRLNRTDEAGKRQGYWKITGALSSESGFRDDQVVEEGEYVDNKREGLWLKFYPTGTIRSEITYVNDFPRGPYRIHYPSGKVEEEGNWQGMRNVGEFKRYHENGRIAQDFQFNAKGKREGTQRYYYPSGQPQLTVEVRNGIAHGDYRTYYADGSLREEKRIVEGRVDSASIVKYPPADDRLASASSLPNDESLKRSIAAAPPETDESAVEETEEDIEKFDRSGTAKLYNHGGQVTQEGEFKQGRLWNGKRYRYTRDGELSKTEIYQNGKFVGYALPDDGS